MNAEQKNKRGRPKGYRVDEPANKTLAGVRLTKTQLEAYKAAAKRSGKTFSSWVRDLLDKGAS